MRGATERRARRRREDAIDWSRAERILRRALLWSVVVATLFWGWKQIDLDALFPLRKVAIGGELEHVGEERLRALVADSLEGGFFRVDVAALAREIEQLPWVDRAVVSKRWPDVLVVMVREQQALARWRAGGVLNVRGERFNPGGDDVGEPLVELDGPPGSEALMARRFQQLQPRLREAGIGLRRMVLSERRAWRMELDDGAEVILGREAMALRLERFLRFYPPLVARSGAIARIDLRYPNGFAVAWRDGAGWSEKRGDDATGV